MRNETPHFDLLKAPPVSQVWVGLNPWLVPSRLSLDDGLTLHDVNPARPSTKALRP